MVNLRFLSWLSIHSPIGTKSFILSTGGGQQGSFASGRVQYPLKKTNSKGFHSSFPNLNGGGGAIAAIGFSNGHQSHRDGDREGGGGGGFEGSVSKRTRFVVSDYYWRWWIIRRLRDKGDGGLTGRSGKLSTVRAS